MEPNPPYIPDDEPGRFAFMVGKAIQNYGTIEYLANDIIANLINDPIVHSHLISQSISKRLDIMFSLLQRDLIDIASIGITPNNIKDNAKTAFRNRNKLAHNPVVAKDWHTEQPRRITTGIHVIRYAEKGHTEEWIHRDQIQEYITQSITIVGQFNAILALVKEKAAKPSQEAP